MVFQISSMQNSFFFCSLSFFFIQISLYISIWSQTDRDPPASFTQILSLKVSATRLNLHGILLMPNVCMGYSLLCIFRLCFLILLTIVVPLGFLELRELVEECLTVYACVCRWSCVCKTSEGQRLMLSCFSPSTSIFFFKSFSDPRVHHLARLFGQ